MYVHIIYNSVLKQIPHCVVLYNIMHMQLILLYVFAGKQAEVAMSSALTAQKKALT